MSTEKKKLEIISKMRFRSRTRTSKNNELKVRQEILLETECGIEDYGIKEIENSLIKMENSLIEENSYYPEIIGKGSDQIPEKVKEQKVLREDTNQENNQNG
ncbi:24574_t:CDS:2 [Gigaspora margarita]|uniref:24574_t:CDS:1 n=1 Tax=Gigaspora margarita TaxID=4874 RepID=A0ABN7W0G3_GIGMA|nr:24574_t:CDS:2 [Gigaspora margarita]